MKNFKFICEHTCTCILCICKISQYYTFTCGLQEKDKYTFFNGPFIFVIGPEICYFCTAYKSQHFSTKFNTFLRNTYKFSWYFFQIFLKLLNTFFDFFKIPSSLELGLQKSALQAADTFTVCFFRPLKFFQTRAAFWFPSSSAPGH